MLRQHPQLSDWSQTVHTHLPHLSKPQAFVLALWSFGMVLAESCALTAVALKLSLSLGCPFYTIRARLKEWYQEADAKSGNLRQELDPTTCFAPLLSWILKDWSGPALALALDATTLGDRFTVLSVSVVYRGNAIPVAWKVLPGNIKHPWKGEWLALLDHLRQVVEPHRTVLVMTDRGLYARWFFQAIVSMGWHPMMRIQKTSTFHPAGQRRAVAVSRLVTKAGQSWKGLGVAFAKTPQRRLCCTLLGRWEPGYEEPWFLITDLTPETAESCWYGLRNWIEQGFKLIKSGGWQWQKTRMTDPQRVERLWLAIAVATMWVLRVGGQCEEQPNPTPEPPQLPVSTDRRPRTSPQRPGRAGNRPGRSEPSRRVDRSDRSQDKPTHQSPAGSLAGHAPEKRRPSGTRVRVVSVFRLGISHLLFLLTLGPELPQGQWLPEPWPVIQPQVQRSHAQATHAAPENPP
jgi:DDE family transposase